MGLALGCLLLNLPWHVTAVMLAEEERDYVRRADTLLSEAATALSGALQCIHTYHATLHTTMCTHARTDALPAAHDVPCDSTGLPLSWVPRLEPRRFGKVLKGDVAACRDVGRRWGVLLDPVYSLAGWEVAMAAAAQGETVAYWHQGGGLGLFGVAQRMPYEF